MGSNPFTDVRKILGPDGEHWTKNMMRTWRRDPSHCLLGAFQARNHYWWCARPYLPVALMRDKDEYAYLAAAIRMYSYSWTYRRPCLDAKCLILDFNDHICTSWPMVDAVLAQAEKDWAMDHMPLHTKHDYALVA